MKIGTVTYIVTVQIDIESLSGDSINAGLEMSYAIEDILENGAVKEGIGLVDEALTSIGGTINNWAVHSVELNSDLF